MITTIGGWLLLRAPLVLGRLAGWHDKFRQAADMGGQAACLRGCRNAARQPRKVGIRFKARRVHVGKTSACGADLSLRLGLHPNDAATYPGLVLKCKPIGVLEVVQTSTGKK